MRLQKWNCVWLLNVGCLQNARLSYLTEIFQIQKERVHMVEPWQVMSTYFWMITTSLVQLKLKLWQVRCYFDLLYFMQLDWCCSDVERSAFTNFPTKSVACTLGSRAEKSKERYSTCCAHDVYDVVSSWIGEVSYMTCSSVPYNAVMLSSSTDPFLF